MPLFNEVRVGTEIPPFSIKMDQPMYKKYNKSVTEINPLHLSEKFARKLGYKKIVVAGVFTYSFFLRPILNWVKDRGYIKQVKIQFKEPIYIEDEIIHHAKVTEKYRKDGINYIEFEVWVENQEHKKVTTGSITLIFNL